MFAMLWSQDKHLAWPEDCTCRPCRGAAKHQTLRLSEGDVAAIRQGSDAEAAAVANVLVVVLNLGVANIDLHW